MPNKLPEKPRRDLTPAEREQQAIIAEGRATRARETRERALGRQRELERLRAAEALNDEET